MKNKTVTNKIIITVLTILLPLTNLFANEDFPDDTDDLTPPAPIDNYILVALVLAVVLAYYYKQTKQLTTNK
ncbi:MAG: hypothetical protein ACK4JX_03985 [Flavobacterium sp.]